jgi:hypothetical protein
MPDAAADVEEAGALMGELEATEGRAFAGARPIATGDGRAVWVGDPDLVKTKQILPTVVR